MSKKSTKQILCPHCVDKMNKYPSMLCAVDEHGDIIIRCKTCKTDVNVSEIQRTENLKKLTEATKKYGITYKKNPEKI